MSDIIHLVYASAANTDISRKVIDDIILKSIENNSGKNITGMLLFAEGSFLQVLEGPREAVEDLFFDIRTDTRHTGIVKIYQEKTEKRIFGKWSMGLASMSNQELARIPGCEDFFQSGKHISAIQESTARRILEAFTRGKWRRKIS